MSTHSDIPPMNRPDTPGSGRPDVSERRRREFLTDEQSFLPSVGRGDFLTDEQSFLPSVDRRDFLKTGLFFGFAGLGGFALLSTLNGCTSPETSGAVPGYSTKSTALTAERWGLVVDVRRLNSVADFESIAAACHYHHNVPHIDNPKNEVKWIWEDDFEHCFEELENAYLPSEIKELEFPALCNHCENPPCVRVCPTEATFKREDGIVNMDYHRCIGCRFCMTACPYNARSLNFFDPRLYIDEIYPDFPTREKGVVEKCNFCVERLEVGLEPYCVEASEGALLFGDLEDPESEVRQALTEGLSIRRLTELGTGPNVYYLLDEDQYGEEAQEEAAPEGEADREGGSHA